MKILIIFVLFLILLIYPTVSRAADDLTDSGKATLFNYPLMKIPIGEGSNSNAAKEQKAEGEASKEEKEKKISDKKVDDAIDKAWGEK